MKLTIVSTILVTLAALVLVPTPASAYDSPSAEFLAALNDDLSTAQTEDESLDRFAKKLHAMGYLSGLVEMVGLQGGYTIDGEFKPVCFPGKGIDTDTAISAIKLTATKVKATRPDEPLPTPRILVLVAFSHAFSCASTGTITRH